MEQNFLESFNNLSLDAIDAGLTPIDSRWGMFGPIETCADIPNEHRKLIEVSVKRSTNRRPPRHRRELCGIPEVFQYSYDRRTTSIASLTIENENTSDITSYAIPMVLRDVAVPCDFLDKEGRVIPLKNQIFPCELCSIPKEHLIEATPSVISTLIAQRLGSSSEPYSAGVVVELCGGYGGNTIELCKSEKIEKVISIEIDKLRCKTLVENCELSGVDMNKLIVLNEDVLSSSDSVEKAVLLSDNKCIDSIFCSPPWGGVGHKNLDWFSLSDVPYQSDDDNRNDTCGVGLICELAKAGWNMLAKYGRRPSCAASPFRPRLMLYLPRHVTVEEIAWLGGHVLTQGGEVLHVEVDRVMMRGPYQRCLHPVFSHKVTLVSFIKADSEYDLIDTSAGVHTSPSSLRCLITQPGFARPKLPMEMKAKQDLTDGATILSTERKIFTEQRMDQSSSSSSPAIWFDQSLLDVVARRLQASNSTRLSGRTELQKLVGAFRNWKGEEGVRLPTVSELKLAHTSTTAASSSIDVYNKRKADEDMDEIRTGLEDWSSSEVECLKITEFGFAVAICEWLNESIGSMVGVIRKIIEMIGLRAVCALMKDAEVIDAVRQKLKCERNTLNIVDMRKMEEIIGEQGQRSRGGIFFNLFKIKYRSQYKMLETIRKGLMRAKKREDVTGPSKFKTSNDHQASKRPRLNPQIPKSLYRDIEPMPSGGFLRDSQGKRIQQEETSKFNLPNKNIYDEL